VIVWGYVAGFFDGEGNLHRDKFKSTVHLRLDNTSKAVLEKIQSFTGYGQISNRGRQKPHHKDRYRLTVADHSKVLIMLEKMLPYLVVKESTAKQMIEYIRGREWRVYRRRNRAKRVPTRSNLPGPQLGA
jgi:hypothetical protein